MIIITKTAATQHTDTESLNMNIMLTMHGKRDENGKR